MKTPSYDRLLHALYGPLTEADWASGFLEQLSRATRSRSAAVVATDVVRRVDTLPAWHGAEASSAAAYEATYGGQNPWRGPSGPVAQQAGVVLVSDDVLPISDLQRTPFYTDFLRPLDVGHGAGLIGLRTANEAASLTLLRDERRGPYRGRELDLLRLLAPHWAHACRMRSRMGLLTDSQRALAEVVDRLALGVLLLDARGRLLRANPTGDRLLSEGQVLALTHERLTALYGPARSGLTLAVDAATARPHASFRAADAIPLCDRHGRVLAVACVHRVVGPDLQQARAAVFIQPVGPPASSSSALRQALMGAYGLTGREAELVARLDAGHELAQAAHAMGLTPGACRTRLKAIFGKTGTHSQAQIRATVSALRSALGESIGRT